MSFEQEDIAQLREIFDVFANKDSDQIDLNELPKVFSSLGIHRTQKELSILMKKYETKNGIDFDNFLQILDEDRSSKMPQKEYISQISEFTAKAQEMFVQLDKDENGLISPDELQSGMIGILGEEAAGIDFKEMFRAADENNDGDIDFREFKNAVKNST